MEIDATIISLLKKLIRKESSSSGGTSFDKNYNNLNNKPSINGVEVSGDKSAEDYGLKPKDFVVNVSLEDNMLTIKSADKTFSQITQAHEEGRDCYVVIDYYGGPFKFSVFNKYNIIASLGENYVNGEYHILDLHCSSEDDWTIAFNNVKATEYSLGKVKANQATEEDNLPVNIDENGFLKVSAQPKDFIINLTTEDGSTFVSDKTYDEVKSAIESGIDIVVSSMGSKFKIDYSRIVDETLAYLSYVSGLVYYEFQIDSDNLVEFSQRNLFPNELNAGGILAEQKLEFDTIPVHVDSDSGFAYAALNVLDKTESDTSYTSEVKKDPINNKLYIPDSSTLQLKLTPVFDETQGETQSEVQVEEQTRSDVVVNPAFGISKLINSNDITFEELESSIKIGRPINAYIDFGEEGRDLGEGMGIAYIIPFTLAFMGFDSTTKLKGISFVNNSFYNSIIILQDGTIEIY